MSYGSYLNGLAIMILILGVLSDGLIIRKGSSSRQYGGNCTKAFIDAALAVPSITPPSVINPTDHGNHTNIYMNGSSRNNTVLFDKINNNTSLIRTIPKIPDVKFSPTSTSDSCEDDDENTTLPSITTNMVPVTKRTIPSTNTILKTVTETSIITKNCTLTTTLATPAVPSFIDNNGCICSMMTPGYNECPGMFRNMCPCPVPPLPALTFTSFVTISAMGPTVTSTIYAPQTTITLTQSNIITTTASITVTHPVSVTITSYVTWTSTVTISERITASMLPIPSSGTPQITINQNPGYFDDRYMDDGYDDYGYMYDPYNGYPGYGYYGNDYSYMSNMGMAQKGLSIASESKQDGNINKVATIGRGSTSNLDSLSASMSGSSYSPKPNTETLTDNNSDNQNPGMIALDDQTITQPFQYPMLA